MNRSKPFWTKWRVVAVVLAMCATGPAYLLYHYNRKVEDWMHEQSRFLRYRFGSGLEHDLCVGNIKADDTVESVIQKYPTIYHEEGGRWTIFTAKNQNSSETTTIIAKDGRLRLAYIGKCYPDYFFDQKLSPEEHEDIELAYALINQKNTVRYLARNTLKVALAGVAANVHFPTYEYGDYKIYFPELAESPKD